MGSFKKGNMGGYMPVANVIKLFLRYYYVAIGITSVIIIGKYGTCGINYAQKVL